MDNRIAADLISASHHYTPAHFFPLLFLAPSQFFFFTLLFYSLHAILPFSHPPFARGYFLHTRLLSCSAARCVFSRAGARSSERERIFVFYRHRRYIYAPDVVINTGTLSSKTSSTNLREAFYLFYFQQK